MNDTQTHAFPSDPAGYQPQQGLTKREHMIITFVSAYLSNPTSQHYTQADIIGGAERMADALLVSFSKQ